MPSNWVAAAIAATSFKRAKISKADVRAGVFTTEDKLKLNYRDSKKVKTPGDIVKNPISGWI